jgi:hypothetical protein
LAESFTRGPTSRTLSVSDAWPAGAFDRPRRAGRATGGDCESGARGDAPSAMPNPSSGKHLALGRNPPPPENRCAHTPPTSGGGGGRHLRRRPAKPGAAQRGPSPRAAARISGNLTDARFERRRQTGDLMSAGAARYRTAIRPPQSRTTRPGGAPGRADRSGPAGIFQMFEERCARARGSEALAAEPRPRTASHGALSPGLSTGAGEAIRRVRRVLLSAVTQQERANSASACALGATPSRSRCWGLVVSPRAIALGRRCGTAQNRSARRRRGAPAAPWAARLPRVCVHADTIWPYACRVRHPARSFAAAAAWLTSRASPTRCALQSSRADPATGLTARQFSDRENVIQARSSHDHDVAALPFGPHSAPCRSIGVRCGPRRRDWLSHNIRCGPPRVRTPAEARCRKSFPAMKT